ncbi:MAG TPA: hypothetical protein VMU01_01975 [Rhizomicrobium sp.]|nr:hypothetical protein [Rhizomicrobium sp.]
MNLVERYIEAVKFWLPKDIRDDVAAELADDIRSEIEEAERVKGRKLTDDEVAAILKARGRPMLVASRYLPRRWLIGPELFPLYVLVLKIVALVSLIPVAVLFVSAVGAHQNIGDASLDLWGQSWNNLWSAFAVVTVIFAVIERQGMNPASLDKWNPKTLRPVADRSRIPRSTSIGDIIGNLILLALFAAGYLSHNVYTSPLGHLTLSPVWVPFCQISVAIGIVEIALSASNLFTPYWTLARIFARALIDLGKTGAFTWLISTNMVREVSVAGLPVPPAGSLSSASVILMQHASAIAGLLVIVIAAHLIWRVFHLKPARMAVAT